MPSDLPAPVSELVWSPDATMQSIEILPVALRDDHLISARPDCADSFVIGWPARISPEDAAQRALEEIGLHPLLLHSTSWRYTNDEAVHTYLAVLQPEFEIPPFWELVQVQRTELARSDARAAPTDISPGQVMEHALRHLAWLFREDVTVHEAIPGWEQILAAYVPEPFRAFNEEQRGMIRARRQAGEPSTVFVGRAHELAELKRLISAPHCRLLTIVGPGGVGKTRLSLEVMREVTPDFPQGAHIVHLQPVTSPDAVVPAIADALGLSLRGTGDLTSQLIDQLTSSRMLLVLDNFEHLSVGAAGIVSRILEDTPDLKVVVSSREPLGLQEEWTFPIDGLDYPTDTDTPDFAEYDSVRLFAQRLTQVRGDFDLDNHREAVARICSLVEGVPLALELAAAWGRSLECDEIAREIERSRNFLQTTLRNVPERHRSIRAVFDESWRLLAESEQGAFERLSIFPGNFRRDAAESVAGASLPILSSLVDKSLLKLLPGGRYHLHELVREFALEALVAKGLFEDTKDRHCIFYVARLHECEQFALSGDELHLCAEMEAEIENIRAAWQWAVDNARVAELGQGVQALAMYGQYRSRYQETANLLAKAAKALEPVAATDAPAAAVLAQVLVQLGWFYVRLGQMAEAQAAAEQCSTLHERLGQTPAKGWASDPAAVLSVVASIRGDFEAAERFGRLALERAETIGNHWNLTLAYYVLTRAAQLTGRESDAERYAREAYRVASEVNDRWFMGYCLLELGNVSALLGRLDAAREYYERSYEARKEFNDPEGMAVALVSLGEASLEQSRYDEALSAFDRAIALYRDLNDIGGRATAYVGRAKASLGLEDVDTSTSMLREALMLATSIRFTPLALSVLSALAGHLFVQGLNADGSLLVHFVAAHRAVDHKTKIGLTRLSAAHSIDQHEPPATAAEVARVTSAALSIPSELVFDRLIDETLSSPIQKEQGSTRPRRPDDLSEREIEVLRLIASGKSNREIAEELFISANTAANHVKSILAKTGSANRAEAATYASRNRLA